MSEDRCSVLRVCAVFDLSGDGEAVLVDWSSQSVHEQKDSGMLTQILVEELVVSVIEKENRL